MTTEFGFAVPPTVVRARTTKPVGRLGYAAAATVLTAGQLAVCLTIFLSAAIGLFYLPEWLFVLFEAAALLLCLWLAVLIFVRAMRSEDAMAHGAEAERINWNPFET